LLRSQPAAAFKLGGERGLAQRLSCHGGDACDIRADIGTGAGRMAGTRRLPRRVRRSEQPGRPVRLAADGVCPGQTGDGLRHGLGVTECLRGGEALDMP
jgi:hypothetical protein